ncbi:MAG: pyridoxal-phosphate dependent enzyme [Deltaproteobacteria bacterium]|nr:pyridoxal-phosphate dependent enzyme [Deltaproteobacteria bacterium]MBW2348810.1 pyridoxal-phosphate dependent enzyme [Deltaproteobacteria bacterium]
MPFLLADARRRNKKRVVTMGGIGTNHGLATAIYCNRLGLDCTLLLFHQPVTDHVRQNMRLFARYGAQMIYCKTINRTVIRFFLLQRIRYPKAYFVFAGGSNEVGTVGFVNAAFELKDQVDREELPSPA